MRRCLSSLLDYELHAVKGFWYLLPDLYVWDMGDPLGYIQLIFNENICWGTEQPPSLSSCSTSSADEKTHVKQATSQISKL